MGNSYGKSGTISSLNCFQHVIPDHVSVLVSLCLLVHFFRFLLQHHPCTSSWGGGINRGLCRPDWGRSDLLHPCSRIQETFLLSQLWWDTHYSIANRLQPFKLSACWMYSELELINSRRDLGFFSALFFLLPALTGWAHTTSCALINNSFEFLSHPASFLEITVLLSFCSVLTLSLSVYNFVFHSHTKGQTVSYTICEIIKL